jgi:hypothetical protein
MNPGHDDAEGRRERGVLVPQEVQVVTQRGSFPPGSEPFPPAAGRGYMVAISCRTVMDWAAPWQRTPPESITACRALAAYLMAST